MLHYFNYGHSLSHCVYYIHTNFFSSIPLYFFLIFLCLYRMTSLKFRFISHKQVSSTDNFTMSSSVVLLLHFFIEIYITLLLITFYPIFYTLHICIYKYMVHNVYVDYIKFLS